MALTPYLAKMLQGYLTEQEFHELATHNAAPRSMKYTKAENKRFADLQQRWDEAHNAHRNP